jgi:hypothetical protein
MASETTNKLKMVTKDVQTSRDVLQTPVDIVRKVATESKQGSPQPLAPAALIPTPAVNPQEQGIHVNTNLATGAVFYPASVRTAPR